MAPDAVSSAFVSLAREPVGSLYQEDIARSAEDRDRLTPRPEVALEWQEVAARLLPDEVQRRTRAILPPDHCISAQRMRTEVRIVDREGRGDPSSVGIDGVRLRVARVRVGDRRDRAAIVPPINQILLA